MQNLRYPFPFLPVSGDVIDATSSKLKFSDLYDLAGTVNVGLYDFDTNAIATGTGNGKKFFIGSSSIHTKDKLDTFIFGMKNPVGNPYWAFKGTDVLSFEYSDSLDARSEEWALGYSGSEGCNLQLPKFECDKLYGIRVTLKGNSITQLIGHEQTYDIYSDIVCCNSDDCVTGCQDNNVDCERILKQIAQRTNESQPSKLVNFKARYVTNTYTAPAVSALTTYRLNMLDDGSNTAWARVQRAVTGGTVEKVGRVGQYSTYEVCTATVPTNLQGEPRFAVPDECGVCPVGSTIQEGSSEFIVNRPLAGTEDLNDSVARQAFADTVGTAYETASAKIFNGTVTGVNIATDTITLAAHGFMTGDKITYSNGGGTSITGLTSGSDYFVISTAPGTLKLATTTTLAYAGTAVDLTAVGVGVSHRLTPVIVATFVSQTGGVAIVRLNSSRGVELTAEGADFVLQGASTEITCTLPAEPNPEAWSPIGTAYRVTRTLCITLQRNDCTSSNRLSELQSYYTVADFPSMVPSSLTLVAGLACEDSYTIQQYSEGCMVDACLAADTSTFVDFGAYAGEVWTLVPPVPPVYNAAKRCGLIFTATLDKTFIDECEFELNMDSTAYPVEFEVSWIVDELVGEAGTVCNFKALTARKLESMIPPRQTGLSVLNRYIATAAYEPFGADYNSQMLRRVLDSNLRKQVDRSSSYRYYYLQFKVDRNNTNFDQKAEVVEAIFVVPNNRPDKMAKLQQAILSPLSKFGIVLKKRFDGLM